MTTGTRCPAWEPCPKIAEIGDTQRALTQREDDEQGKDIGLMQLQRGPQGVDDGGPPAIPWHRSGLLPGPVQV